MNKKIMALVEKNKPYTLFYVLLALVIFSSILLTIVVLIANTNIRPQTPIVVTNPPVVTPTEQTPEIPATQPETEPEDEPQKLAPVVTTSGDFKINYTGKPVRKYGLYLFQQIEAPQNESNDSYADDNFEYGADLNTTFDYYLVGKFAEGKYKNYDLIYAFNRSVSPYSGDQNVPATLTFVVAYKVSTEKDKLPEIIIFNKMLDYENNPVNIFLPARINAYNNISIDNNLSIYSTLIFASEHEDLKLTESRSTTQGIFDVYSPNDVVKTVSYNGQQLYNHASAERIVNLTQTESGFYMGHWIEPMYTSFPKANTDVSNDVPNINWSYPTTHSNNEGYTYMLPFQCGGTINYVDINPADLIEIGKNAAGSSVYKYKDDAKDTYVKKIYDEDYANIETFHIPEYNQLTEDDTKPLSYAEYLKHIPVFYWKDEFGRYVRFINLNFVMVGGCAKPAVYLYPEKTTEINVSVEVNGLLTLIYPRFNGANSWNVTAESNGQLTVDNQKFDYLWWESQKKGNLNYDSKKGFVLDKENVETELNSLLSQMNLNDKEKAQFIEYWLPELKKVNTDKIYMTFLFNEQINQIAKLNITPKPQNEFRVFMLFKPVDSNYKVSPLKLEKANRDGYTVVEWGGAAI